MDPQQQLTLVAAAMTRDELVANGASDVSFAPTMARALHTAFSANGASGTLAVGPLFDLSMLAGRC